jgi:hypothetical protein
MDAIFLDGASIAKPRRETWAEFKHMVAGSGEAITRSQYARVEYSGNT